MGPLDLTNEKISFTFQRLVQTDGTDFYDGVGNPINIGSGVLYFQNTPPASPKVGERWFHSDTGIEYVYLDDGISQQWVQPY